MGRKSADLSNSSADIGRLNAEKVVRTLLADGPLSRAVIAERVGMTRGTVTRVTGRLVDLGFLREQNPVRPDLGRPSVPLAIAGDAWVVATAHFGVREMRIGLVGIRGEVLVERRFPNPSADPEAVLRLAAAELTALVSDEVAGRTLLGVGACVGGWVNPETGRVVEFNALGWQQFPLADVLESAVGLPVHFDQMVRGLALGERMFGAARHHRDFIELWLGNIMGAAVVTNGLVRRGTSGASGLVGHAPVRGAASAQCVCGRTACLGSVASDSAVLGQAKAAGAIADTVTMRELVDIARGGSGSVGEVVSRAATYAGRAAAAMVDLLDPALLVVGGHITEAPQFLPAFRTALFAESQYHRVGDLPVVGSVFGDAAPTVAAASIVLNSFYQDPLSIAWASAAPPVGLPGRS